jgi:hypothetical protein
MNVTFHTLASFATAAALSARLENRNLWRFPSASDTLILGGGFITGILIHGILDTTPHNYPIPSVIDILLSLILFPLFLLIAKRYLWLLIAVCFAGAIFPDLVDLATNMVNRRIGTSLPVVKIFPWHWRQYSGSIYDGSRRLESAIYHLVVAAISFSILYISRKRWLRGELLSKSTSDKSSDATHN